MVNMLLENPDYKIEQTATGVWRHYGYENGRSFHEFRSNTIFMGLPLIHYTSGICPETGSRIVAQGIIAIGRIACGVVAIGQVSIGIIAIGQLAIGLLFGLGQLATGIAAVAQAAFGVYFGLGQVATGYIAIGQLAFGKYVFAQFGFGDYVLSMTRKDPDAIEFFKTFPIIREFMSS